MNVMLVDDEPMVRDDLLHMIDWEKEGFHVIACANNGRSGWELYCKYKPDIVVTDIYMPVADGFYLSQKIAESGCSTAVILLSSYNDFTYAQQAIGLGVYRYLLKHTLNAEILTDALTEARDKLVELNQRQWIYRHSVIKDFLRGQSEWNEITLFREQQAGSSWLCVFLQDPMTSLARENSPLRLAEDVLERALGELGYPDILTVTLHQQLVTVMPIEQHGARDQEQQVQLLIRDLFNVLSAQAKQNMAGAYTVIPSQLEQLRDAYRRWSECRDNAYLIPPHVFQHCVMSLDQFRMNCGPYPRIREKVLKQKLRDISHELRILNYEKVEEILEAVRKELTQPPWDHKAASSCVTRLWMAFSDALPSPTETEEQFTSVDSLFAYFSDSMKSLGLLQGDEAKKTYSPPLCDAMAYIAKNYGQDIGLESIAGAAGVTAPYLSQLFHHEMGMTCVKYLTQYRIGIAKKLLSNNSYPINEVARLCGYQSDAYFSNVFKKATGTSPKQFRADAFRKGNRGLEQTDSN